MGKRSIGRIRREIFHKCTDLTLSENSKTTELNAEEIKTRPRIIITINKKAERIRNLKEYRQWIQSEKNKSNIGLCNKKVMLMNETKINHITEGTECDELKSQEKVVIKRKCMPNRGIRSCDHKKSHKTQIQNKPMVKQEDKDSTKEQNENRDKRKRP